MSNDHAGTPEDHPGNHSAAPKSAKPRRSTNSRTRRTTPASTAGNGSHASEVHPSGNSNNTDDQNSAIVPAELVEAVEEEAARATIRTLQAASFSGPLPMAGEPHLISCGFPLLQRALAASLAMRDLSAGDRADARAKPPAALPFDSFIFALSPRRRVWESFACILGFCKHIRTFCLQSRAAAACRLD